MQQEIKLTEEQSKKVREFFERGYAYKQAVADLAEKAHLSNQEGWRLIKEYFPDTNFNQHRYTFDPNTGIIKRCEERNTEIIIK